MTLIEKIREMIAEGETERSLKELYEYVKENNADVIDKLIMLRSRMQNLQNALLTGTMDEQDASIERAKINEAILKLLPQLTPEYLAQTNQMKESEQYAITAPKLTSAATTPINRKKIYIIGGVIGLVLLVIILIFNNSGSSGNEDLVQQESTIGEDQTVQESTLTLLSNILADGAVWASNNNDIIFQFESDKVCNEITNGQIAHTFNVIDNDNPAEYITLYDPSRKMFLLIGRTTVQFQNEGEDTWNNLYTGEWVIPTEEE